MIRATLKIFLLAIWTVLWFLPVWTAKRMSKLALRDQMIQHFCKGMLFILGIRLKVRGHVSDLRPLLLVTNHLSYFDVPIIASQAAARFTPKLEIGSWPLIGSICHLADSIFVERRAGKLKAASQTMQAAFNKGEIVSLFPESTTGNGLHVLPFKSGFFSLAEEKFNDRELAVQPAAITFTHVRRLPVDSSQWPTLAWYGDMYLMPHFWNVLKMGPIDAELIFLPTVHLSEFGDRKRLAVHCHEAITQAIESTRLERRPRPYIGLRERLSIWSRSKS